MVKTTIRWADDHPVLTTCLLALLIFVGLRTWSAFADEPVLLARAEAEQRVTIYGQVAGSSVAMLGIALTVLAILLALPDRPVVSDIRHSDTWPRLRGLLLTIGLLALVALVMAHLGAAIDTTQDALEWLPQLMLSASAAALVALLAAGLTFWLVLKRSDEPDDPSRGRGQG